MPVFYEGIIYYKDKNGFEHGEVFLKTHDIEKLIKRMKSIGDEVEFYNKGGLVLRYSYGKLYWIIPKDVAPILGLDKKDYFIGYITTDKRIEKYKCPFCNAVCVCEVTTKGDVDYSEWKDRCEHLLGLTWNGGYRAKFIKNENEILVEAIK